MVDSLVDECGVSFVEAFGRGCCQNQSAMCGSCGKGLAADNCNGTEVVTVRGLIGKAVAA